MNYITTTDLRTKSSQLVQSLLRGMEISLIHRSKVVARIQPIEETGKLFDSSTFKRLIDRLNLSTTTYNEREKSYNSHLLNKYGKGIS